MLDLDMTDGRDTPTRTPMAEPTSSGALAGIKVVDLTRVLGGPYATQVFGDHGADVIKVEPPEGDEVRAWGPPFRNGDASYYIGVNRNKRSLALDLARPEGREVLLTLLGDADVLIENFKPGTLEKWGLGYDEVLAERFPRLIHCRISGFGGDGPRGGLPGYDAIIQAMTGMFQVNGAPDSGPTRIGVPLVDMGTGLYAAVGVLMALIERGRSDRGQFLEVPLYDSALALMHPHAANYFLSGKAPGLTGNAHPNISPYETFVTDTGPIFVGVGNDRTFRRLCVLLGDETVADEPRFRTNSDRLAHRAALKVEIERLLVGRDANAVADHLLSGGVPAGALRGIDAALDDPQARHRGAVLERDGYRGVASPIRFSRSRAILDRLPPNLNADAAEVLAEHGYDEDAITALDAAGVTGPRRKS
jgi:crotonobetainyl-CoA:carnitine CoA-transferase CaiB-like acyl-CoA transferase